MSVAIGNASVPEARNSAARASAPAPSKSTSTTLHPRAASARTMAIPMPRGFAVPVTTAILPAKSFIAVSRHSLGGLRGCYVVESEQRDGGLAHGELLDLASHGHRKLVADVDVALDLVMRDPPLTEL